MTQTNSPMGRHGRRLVTVLLALIGLSLALVVAPAAQAETVTIGSLGPATEEGACTECATFQTAVAPGSTGYEVPPGQWTISSWSGQGGLYGGTAVLEVFRPTGLSGQYRLIAKSAPQTVPATTIGTAPAAIPVEGGDLLGLETGADGAYPFLYGPVAEADVTTGVIGAPQVGQIVGPGGALKTVSSSQYRLNVAAQLTQPGGPSTTPLEEAPSTRNVLDLYVEGAGNLGVAGTVLDCPWVCASAFPTGTAMTVTATPGLHAEFAGWSGGVCRGSALSCAVVLGGEVQVTGRFIPAHGLTLGEVWQKVKHGRVRTVQRVKVENPGTLNVTGKGVVAAKIHAAKAGAVTLPLVAKGKALRALLRSGAATTKVRVTFTPDGGTPNAVSQKVTFGAGQGR